MAPLRTRRALRTAPRRTRGTPSFSYAELSSDDSDLEETEKVRAAIVPSPQRSGRSKPRNTHVKRRRSNLQSSNDSDDPTTRASKKRRTRGISSPAKPTNLNTVYNVPTTSDKIPPWHTLPYQILVQIFRYASYPLYDENTFQPLESSRQLCKIARLCRSFAEPAFTVLYASPPLVPMDKARKVVEILKTNPAHMAFKYRQKVKSLHIDVGQVAAYSLGAGLGHLDLHGLIRNLPRLVDLELYHQYDMAPYRMLDDSIKWTYPESLFQALEYIDPEADPSRGDKTGPCRLRSWRWSSRMAGKRWPIESLREVHLRQPFVGLKKLAFVNYQIPKLKKDEENPRHEKVLAEAISALQSLEHLIFESSTLLNAKLLPLLPHKLRHIEFTNCWEITAQDFGEFLLTHGSQLRCLTLNHNQALSLSFLPSLAAACPKLQVLRMNLTYYKVHTTYDDSSPDYAKLLLPDEIPAWPSTLQIFELIQLRQWETEAAEMFFQSLLDSAGELPDLRRMTIQAIIDIPWRERASFRDKWIGEITRVFKRVCKAPNIINQGTSGRLSVEIPASKSDHKKQTPSEPTRKSSRVLPPKPQEPDSQSSRRHSQRSHQATNYAESSSSELDMPSDPDDEDGDKPSPQRIEPRSRRAAKELASLQSSLTPPTSDSSTQSPKEKGEAKKGQAIQGMCEIVDLRIDNLRPRENQVTEADFLDDEPAEEEDPDWDGDMEGEGEGYAW